jgi:hypothetical protein
MKKASQRDTWKDTNYTDPGKNFTQKLHCIRNFRERLGIKLTDQDYDHMVSCIRNEKESDRFTIKYQRPQSNRLDIYEITFNGYVPVDVIYDKQRKSIVTILFQNVNTLIDFYYDVFNNKVSLKHDLGFNCGWSVDGENLMIPSEVVEKKDGYWEVVSDGILREKRFKFDNESLIEVM